MAGIVSGRIKYALGKQTAIGTRAIDEGLPLLAHTIPTPVTDSLKGADTTFGYEYNYHRPGTVYYTAQARIPYAPAWACRLLDLYFEDTAIGAASNYDRTYKPEDIPSEPSEWLSLWKYTAKTGYDHCTVGLGGVIYGVTIEGSENNPLTLTADIAFCQREDDTATGTPSDWDINESSGNYTPLQNTGGTFLIAGTNRGIVSWRVSIRHAFRPHFWAEQTPNRISRLGYQVTGEFVLRDIDDALKGYEADFLASTTRAFMYVSIGTGNYILLNTPKITAPEIYEEGGTRYGRYSFTGLSSKSGGTPPVTIFLRPQVAGL